MLLLHGQILCQKTQRHGALGGALETIAASDPNEAARRLLELDAGDAREKAAGSIANLWAKRAPQEAMEWAMTLEGDDRESAMSRALGGLGLNRTGGSCIY